MTTLKTQNRRFWEAFAKQYGFQIASDLTQEQRYELLNVLYEFKDTFALEITDMKIHQKYVAHLELKHPGMTVRYRQFPLSQEDAAEIDKQILEMEEIGLIEQSEDTTFNRPIFLIKKKHTGNTRFVIDLRKVNDIFKPMTLILPRIDDVLQEIASRKPTVYSSLDLFKGFWAISLEKNSRKYTNFYLPKSGIPYRYCTLPMGLNSFPTHFQRMTFAIFHNKEYWYFLHLYVDDLLLTSKNFEDHLMHLKQTLQTWRINKLMANPSKAYLDQSTITYLGHELSPNGVTLSGDNVKSMKKTLRYRKINVHYRDCWDY